MPRPPPSPALLIYLQSGPEKSFVRLLDAGWSGDESQGVTRLHCREIDEEYREATTMFLISLSAFVLGLAFFLLGYFKLTRIIQWIPTLVLGGRATAGARVCGRSWGAADARALPFPLGRHSGIAAICC